VLEQSALDGRHGIRRVRDRCADLAPQGLDRRLHHRHEQPVLRAESMCHGADDDMRLLRYVGDRERGTQPADDRRRRGEKELVRSE